LLPIAIASEPQGKAIWPHAIYDNNVKMIHHEAFDFVGIGDEILAIESMHGGISSICVRQYRVHSKKILGEAARLGGPPLVLAVTLGP
jgi:PhoPQ-activated pathogenicity-related protein